MGHRANDGSSSRWWVTEQIICRGSIHDFTCFGCFWNFPYKYELHTRQHVRKHHYAYFISRFWNLGHAKGSFVPLKHEILLSSRHYVTQELLKQIKICFGFRKAWWIFNRYRSLKFSTSPLLQPENLGWSCQFSKVQNLEKLMWHFKWAWIIVKWIENYWLYKSVCKINLEIPSK